MRAIGGTMRAFAEAFAGRVRAERDIALEIMLHRAGLDYSPASLEIVDRYLDDVHESVRPPSGWRGLLASKRIERTPELDNTIIWGGAYVGEVLRRLQLAWLWMDYDDYVERHPDMRQVLGPREMGTTMLLVKDDGSMTMPVNKVARYVHEGSEHSTHHYVRAFA